MQREIDNILSLIKKNDLFTECIKDESTVVTGPSSELDSIIMVQLIGFLEDYAETNNIQIDLLEFISENQKDLSLADFIELIHREKK